MYTLTNMYEDYANDRELEKLYTADYVAPKIYTAIHSNVVRIVLVLYHKLMLALLMLVECVCGLRSRGSTSLACAYNLHTISLMGRWWYWVLYMCRLSYTYTDGDRHSAQNRISRHMMRRDSISYIRYNSVWCVGRQWRRRRLGLEYVRLVGARSIYIIFCAFCRYMYRDMIRVLFMVKLLMRNTTDE